MIQVQLEELHEALVNDDQETVQQLLFFESEKLGRHNLALDARLSVRWSSADRDKLLTTRCLTNRATEFRCCTWPCCTNRRPWCG